jgi:hypothetical protein
MFWIYCSEEVLPIDCVEKIDDVPGKLEKVYRDARIRAEEARRDYGDFFPFNWLKKCALRREGGSWFVFDDKGAWRFVRRWYLSKPIREITREEFDDALNVTPPVQTLIDGVGDVVRFASSEGEAYSFRRQYLAAGGRYWTAIVDDCDETTFLDYRWENSREDFPLE